MTTTDTLTDIFRDNFVAYFRSHQAHVNITGRNFASDHKLLQKIYEDLQAQIDTIGELLRTLGEYMPCDLGEVVAQSKIDTGELAGTSDFLLEMVLQDLDSLVESYRELIEVSDGEGNSEIANYAQDRILALKKFIWMITSTIG